MAISVVKTFKKPLREFGLNEQWLEEEIRADSQILGLGKLEVVQAQRSQESGGRLDVLLFDRALNTRYVVELMLGSLDASHLVRAIEYWDIERRRYPGYEHVAVVAAEDISSRYLNVISLMSGNIPLIVLQVNAFAVSGGVALHVVRLLSLIQKRLDDVGMGGENTPAVDRSSWERGTGSLALKVAETLLPVFKKRLPEIELNFRQQYIGLKLDGVSRNFVYFKSLKGKCRLWARVGDSESWSKRFQEVGLEGYVDGDEWAGVDLREEILKEEPVVAVIHAFIQASMVYYQDA